MAIILLMWGILIFWGISKNNDQQMPFNPKQTAALRGICAIEIMIGHIGLATGNIVLYPNRKAGILFVGIFFILSGYGIAYSVDHKKDYMRHFLLNRTIKLLLPAYTVRIAMLLIEYFLPDFTGIGLRSFLTDLNWYVWEQLLFYLIYWLVYKVIPAHVELIVGICSGLFILLAYISGMDNPWYGSSLCFTLGLVYYQYEKKKYQKAACDKAICPGNMYYYVSLISLLFITGVSIILFFILGNDSILGNPIARNIASAAFGIAVIMLLYKFKIGNKASRFLGQYSYEIFLVHPYMLSILSKVSVKSEALLGILTVVLTVISACLIHLLIRKVFDLFKYV